MNWQPLLNNQRVRLHQTSSQELDDLRAVVARDLQDASLTGLSADRRFATAYNAVLQLATMVVACSGYRVAARTGHHVTTFEALGIALGSDHSDLIDYFQSCRAKRNQVDYDVAGAISGADSEELLDKADAFHELVESWIRQHYPQFAT